MNATEITALRPYKELKTELKICRIGGLFLALYKEEASARIIIDLLKRDMPEHFTFDLHMDSRKIAFPIFFEQTFEQTGKGSNIFHVIGIESLFKELKASFIDYLQYTRERLKAKPYSLVFWITTEFEKELFFSAPDFYHWLSGTYDFSQIKPDPQVMTPISFSNAKLELAALTNIKEYLKNVIYQYEHWKDVKQRGEEFLIEVMGRANLKDYYVESYSTDEKGRDRPLNDLFEEFLTDPSKTFLALLGDFGTGKSSFALFNFIQLARKYLEGSNIEHIPIFISLKNYPGKINIEDFVVVEFYKKFNIQLTFSIFQSLALKGRFVFFVDGFDEMMSNADHRIIEENFKEITKLTFENLLFMTQANETLPRGNKVFLTCRTHYFLTEIEEREIHKIEYTIFYREYATKSNYEISKIKLKEFNQKQIEEYVLKAVDNKQAAENILSVIQDTYNLKELSTRPLLLEMMIKTLPALRERSGINVSILYRVYTGMWIDRDDWRSQMTSEGKRAFMWDLALKAERKSGDFSMHYSELEKPADLHLKESFEKKDEDFYRYETTTCSFLNRDALGNYRFIHKSFMEYLIAEYYFHRIRGKQATLPYHLFSKEINFFVKSIISAEKSDLRNLNLKQLYLDEIDLSNGDLSGSSLELARLSGADLRGAKLLKSDFRGTHLSNSLLMGADLTQADLGRANLSKANLEAAILERADLQAIDLTRANLRGAQLLGANLGEANLQRADLRGANLTEANLSHANLYQADLRGATLRFCRLTSADLTGANVHGADLEGASLRGANLKRALYEDKDLTNTCLEGAILPDVALPRL